MTRHKCTHSFKRCLNRLHAINSNPSKAERRVAAILDQLNFRYVYDARIETFIGRGGKQFLRFDFVIVKEMQQNTHTTTCNNWQIDTIIECQGAFHYHVVPGCNSRNELRQQQINDELKRAHCARTGIQLIEIPYWARPHPLIINALHSR